MSNKRWIVLALALAIVVLPMDARSQNEATDIKVKDLTGHLDLSIPQSPAFTMLGVSPDEIVQSDDFRTVALGLLRGLDPRGNLQEGVALDTRPYMLIAGETATLAEYRTDPFVRIISNAQLSFATTSGSSDSDQADRLGLGLRLRLWREHDPAVGDSQIEYVSPGGAAGGVKVTGPLKNCYTDYLKAAVNVDPEVLPEDDAELDKIEQNLAAGARKTVEQCLAPFKRRYWNAGMLEIGVGGSRVTIDAMKEGGSAAWRAIPLRFRARHPDGRGTLDRDQDSDAAGALLARLTRHRVRSVQGHLDTARRRQGFFHRPVRRRPGLLGPVPVGFFGEELVGERLNQGLHVLRIIGQAGTSVR
jgi:hypothetical protein